MNGAFGSMLVFAPRRTTTGYEMADGIVRGQGPNCSSTEYPEGVLRGNPNG